MKKLLLFLLLVSICSLCFSRIKHKECDHEWVLTEIVDGHRHWVCNKCGDDYIAKNAITPETINSVSIKCLKIVGVIFLIFLFVLLIIAYTGKDYNEERRFVNTICFVIPVSISFIIFFKLLDTDAIFGGIVSLALALILGCIGSAIGNTINIHRAKYYNIPDDDNRVKEEKAKRTTAIIAALSSTAYLAHKTKDGVKDVTDVDNWKEFK